MFPDDYVAALDRRLASFAIFVSIFLFTLTAIDRDIMLSFKVAIVLISCAMAIIAIFTLAGLTLPETAGTDAKELVGSQRFGFVYIYGFWLAYLYQTNSPRIALLKYVAASIILAGLVLTFSRASIIGFIGSAAIYAILTLRSASEMSSQLLGKVVVGALLWIGILGLSYIAFPIAFVFFSDSFTALFLDSGISQEITDAESSGGVRAVILKEVLAYISYNPLTGASFLGPWILRGDYFASAHNQYLDILFRTGIVGFAIYMYLFFAIFTLLRKNHSDLFIGFCGVALYGFFHETYKESQGAAIFAFLLGMLAQSRFELRKTRMNPSIRPGTRQRTEVAKLGSD